MSYKNCTKCPAHEVQSDPDPHDWFCDDDVKVVCKHMKDEKTGTYKTITVACRPTNIKKECETPKWCPMKGNKNV